MAGEYDGAADLAAAWESFAERQIGKTSRRDAAALRAAFLAGAACAVGLGEARLAGGAFPMDALASVGRELDEMRDAVEAEARRRAPARARR